MSNLPPLRKKAEKNAKENFDSPILINEIFPATKEICFPSRSKRTPRTVSYPVEYLNCLFLSIPVNLTKLSWNDLRVMHGILALFTMSDTGFDNGYIEVKPRELYRLCCRPRNDGGYMNTKNVMNSINESLSRTSFQLEFERGKKDKREKYTHKSPFIYYQINNGLIRINFFPRCYENGEIMPDKNGEPVVPFVRHYRNFTKPIPFNVFSEVEKLSGGKNKRPIILFVLWLYKQKSKKHGSSQGDYYEVLLRLENVIKNLDLTSLDNAGQKKKVQEIVYQCFEVAEKMGVLQQWSYNEGVFKFHIAVFKGEQ